MYSEHASNVGQPTRMLNAGAALQKRAAVLTVSPSAVYCRRSLLPMFPNHCRARVDVHAPAYGRQAMLDELGLKSRGLRDQVICAAQRQRAWFGTAGPAR